MNPSLRKYAPHFLAIFAFGILALVSGLLWMERSQRFPIPNTGAYIGEISGLSLNGGGAPLPIYLERSSNENRFLIMVASRGWEPIYVSESAAAESEDERSVLPVELKGPEGNIRLRGSKSGPGDLVGIAEDTKGGKSGKWHLTLISGRGPTSAEPNEDQIKLWLNLKEELIDIESQIDNANARIPEQKQEVEKLSLFVTEKDRLKNVADDKYRVVKDELEKAKTVLKEKQEKAKRLEEKLTLAQRVTPMGRIVSLARESIDREARWVESMYRVSSGKESPEIEEAVREGEKLLALKREIAKERERILELRGEAR